MAQAPVCEKCGGSGWLIVERALVSGAEPCSCRAEGAASRLEERAEIPLLYRNASLDNFLTDPPELKGPAIDVRNYVENFYTHQRPGLLLIGETGTGKTHLAVAAIHRLIAKWSLECLFCDYQNLLNRIRAGYDASSNSSDRDAYRIALDAEVLLLDDLGAQRVTDWVEDTVTSIVTYRCNNRKPLIATTNLPDGDAGSAVYRKSALGLPEYRVTLADRIGARARSRLFEMCTVIRMPLVEDYRVRRQRTF